jgi:flagellar hook assembly protein FlgD
MKKVFAIAILGGTLALASCGGGPSAEDKAAAEQAKLDSIKAAEQAKLDAEAAAAAAAAEAEAAAEEVVEAAEEVVEEVEEKGGKMDVTATEDGEKSGKDKLDVKGNDEQGKPKGSGKLNIK